MANWSNPTLTSLYTDFVTEVKNRDVDLALGLDPATTSPTNVPANAIRWNSASFKYQKWDGSTWNDLSAKYIFTAVEVSGATVPVNGMYLSTTNTLNFSTASTASRLTIDGSGNVNIDSGTFYVDAVNNRVGIGTTGPSSPLHVYSVGNTELLIGGTQTPILNLIGGAGTDPVIGYGVGALRFGTTTGAGAAGFSAKMTLDASGNLGLGVVPSAWASVAGLKAFDISTWTAVAGNSAGSALFFNTYYGNTGYTYKQSAAAGVYELSDSHRWFTAPSGTAGNPITFTQAMTLDASGNLGIKNTSPTSYNAAADDLVVGLSGDTGMTIVSGTANQGSIFFADGTTGGAQQAAGYLYYLHNNDSMGFGTANTLRMTLDASGNVNIDSGTFYVDAVNNRVGIGTTGPGYLLDVVGTGSQTAAIRTGTSGDPRLYLEASGVNAGFVQYSRSSQALQLSGQNPTVHATLDASGNVNIDSGTFYVDAVNNRVGIGTIGPSYAFDVANSVIQVGNGTDAFVQYKSTAGNWHVGVTGGGAYNFYTGTYGTGAFRMSLDASGNLGLGVTPSALWNSGGNLQIANGVFTASSDATRVMSNVVFSSALAGGPAYITSSQQATQYLQNAGAHIWFTAPSGTAGNPITFTQAMTLDASGRLLVGTSSARTPLTHSPSLQVEGVGYAPSTISVIGNSNDINGSYIFIGKSRGTSVGSNTIVQSGDEIGGLDFIATDGTQALRAARITAHVDGTPGANDMPGRLVFSTTADGAASPTERLRLDSTGRLLHIGGGSAASPAVQFHGNAGAGSLLIDSSGYITSKSGRIPAKQYYRLDSAFTGTNGTAAQPIYGVGVTLIGSTVYEFEAIYAFSRSTGSTSHTMSFLFGGTATINNIFYTGVGPGDGILPPLSTYDGGPASFVATSAGASVATAAMTIGTGIFYIVKGTVSINAGGTFIPQYQLSAAPGGAYSTYAGAYFSIWPLAASGAAVNIGSWA